ncbi:MAG: alpha/beta hydrolase fold domain-containing protein [Deltaproteobacteria bacterium]|nr:alpha/beta hydrolase fold domain-containing protein [Deltaproteobacteria bacterium]
MSVYRDLLDTYGPGQIALFGSSAGGGLTAAVIVAARDAGLPLPAAAVMHTLPVRPLSKIGDSYYTNEGVDPMLTTYDGGLEAGARAYAGGAGLSHPLVSPIYADLSKGFPPSFLSTGTRDLLLSCTVPAPCPARSRRPRPSCTSSRPCGTARPCPRAASSSAKVCAFLENHLNR